MSIGYGIGSERISIMGWLLRFPLITVKQLEAAGRMPEYRLYRRLTRLAMDGMVGSCSLRGAGRMQARWHLVAAGAERAAQAVGLPNRWQAVQEGIASLVHRTPVVEYFYDLALALGGRPVVVDAKRPGHGSFVQAMTAIGRRFNLTFLDLIWCGGEAVDALMLFSEGRWFCVCWVGPAQTWHDLRIRLERVRHVPGATLDAETGTPLRPSGWVFLCNDRLAAALVAELWPGEDALIVTVSGHVERAMRLDSLPSPFPRGEKQWDLGHPEWATQWAKQDTPLWALEHEKVYDVFRFITEHRGATRSQLKREFGSRYSGALHELGKRPHGFIVERDGAVYPSEKGGKAWAALDGADREKVLSRLGEGLGYNGRHRRNQQPHDQAQIDVRHKLLSEGIECFGGYRNLRNLEGVTQLRPDLMVCLRHTDGSTLPVYLEIEFAAKHPKSSASRPSNYLKAPPFFDDAIPSFWVLPNKRVRKLYQAAIGREVAFTATFPELMAGTSLGNLSAWRNGIGERVPITDIVKIMEIDIPED